MLHTRDWLTLYIWICLTKFVCDSKFMASSEPHEAKNWHIHMKYSRSNIVWSTVSLLKRSQVSTPVSVQYPRAKQNAQSKREDVAIVKEHICIWCSRVTESGAQCVVACFATLQGPNVLNSIINLSRGCKSSNYSVLQTRTYWNFVPTIPNPQ